MSTQPSDRCKTVSCPNSNSGGGRERCAFHHLAVAQRPRLPSCSCRVIRNEHHASCAWRAAVMAHG